MEKEDPTISGEEREEMKDLVVTRKQGQDNYTTKNGLYTSTLYIIHLIDIISLIHLYCSDSK